MAVSQGIMQKRFVSAIDFLDQRDIDPNLYDVARDRHFTDIMKLVGRYSPAEMYYYHTFQNENVWEQAVISGGILTNGNAQVTFAVTVGSGFPRVSDLISTNNVNNVGVQARVQSVTVASGVATLVVRTVNNVPFYATIGDFVSFSSNAQAERSDAPTNRRYAENTYYNLIQEFREVDDITDIQKTSKIETYVNGQPYILPYQIIQKQVYLQGTVSYQMIAGVQSTTQFSDANPFLQDASGFGIQTTMGLDQFTTTYGSQDSAAVLGTFGLAELTEITDLLLAVKAPKDYFVFCSTKTKRIADIYFKNLGSAGITSVRMIVDGKDVNMEVDRFEFANFNFEFVPLEILDHPQLFGPVRPDITGSFYFVPKGDTETVGGGREPHLGIKYKTPAIGGGTANSSNNGIIAEWRTGALAENTTSNVNQLTTNWVTYQGLNATGVKQFLKYRIV